MNTIEKTCPECSTPFLWQVGRKGVQTFCSQSCRLKRWRRERRAADPDKVRAEDRAAHYRNREKRVARMKVYADKHREKIRRQGREWRAANVEYARDHDRQRWTGERRQKMNERHKVTLHEARVATPWKYLLITAAARAARKKVPFALTAEWAAARWTGRCEVTGLEFKIGQRTAGPKFWGPSIDRITPELGYTPDNCRFVLWAINSFKNSGTDEDMIIVARAILDNLK